MDMRFYWLVDQVEQGLFKVYWALPLELSVRGVVPSGVFLLVGISALTLASALTSAFSSSPTSAIGGVLIFTV